MCDVYRSAYVVIVAASSPNAVTPFLGPRDARWNSRRIPIETATGGTGYVCARRRSLLIPPLEYGLNDPPLTISWATRKRDDPVSRRAWCFQEHFLATRSLYFASGAIIFECRTHRQVEDQLPPYVSTVPNESIQQSLSKVDNWRMLVKSYTNTRLTFPNDRLPALSGIASSIHGSDLDPSNYIAGLWRDSLVEDLLWHVVPPAASTYFHTDAYVAPSWSWASVRDGVVWNPLRDPKILIDIVDVNVTLKGRNPWGEVSDAFLELRGRLVRCRVRFSVNDRKHYVSLGHHSTTATPKEATMMGDGLLVPDSVHLPTGGTLEIVRRAVWDEDSGKQDKWPGDFEMPAWFLPVVKTSWTNYNVVGLVLSRSMKAEGCFERIGIVSNLRKEWLGKAAIGQVKMV